MVNVTYDASHDLVATYDPTQDPAVYNLGDMAWMIVASVLVMIMPTGVGFLYSGLLRRKNALSMLFFSTCIYCVATIQWFFWGYSLTFDTNGSENSKGFIGSLGHFGLINVLDQPSPGSTNIPELLFCLYQGMFAATTAVIASGGCAERGRVFPLLVFFFCWLTLVYNVVACWTWNPNGWIFSHGGLDFAGGGPVHIASGTCALALSIFLGKRRGYGTPKLSYRPYSVTNVVIGTIFLYFGWFGFNGGSAFGANLRSVQACIVTNVSASAAGLTWLAMDYFFTRQFSCVSLCTGIIVGLVGITPGAGFVGAPAALAIGVVTAFFSNLATSIKRFIRYDEPCDVFATHGIGGWVGSFLTGLFADNRVTGFDGVTEGSGWINRNFEQLGWQIAGATSIMAYTFVVSLIILFALNWIPGLRFHVSDDAEVLGIDEEQLGEVTYDYAFLHSDESHSIAEKPSSPVQNEEEVASA